MFDLFLALVSIIVMAFQLLGLRFTAHIAHHMQAGQLPAIKAHEIGSCCGARKAK